MGTVTMPTPWAIFALTGLAGFAVMFLGLVVLSLLGQRDRQRLEYLVKVSQAMDTMRAPSGDDEGTLKPDVLGSRKVQRPLG
jgi:hypothetical protein